MRGRLSHTDVLIRFHRHMCKCDELLVYAQARQLHFPPSQHATHKSQYLSTSTKLDNTHTLLTQEPNQTKPPDLFDPLPQLTMPHKTLPTPPRSLALEPENLMQRPWIHRSSDNNNKPSSAMRHAITRTELQAPLQPHLQRHLIPDLKQRAYVPSKPPSS